MSYLSPKLLIVKESFFRDAVAKALIAQAHREVAEEVTLRFGTDPGCGGHTAGDGACGGCRDCVYAQNTWLDHTGDGWARWQVRAAELVATIRTEMAAAG